MNRHYPSDDDFEFVEGDNEFAFITQQLEKNSIRQFRFNHRKIDSRRQIEDYEEKRKLRKRIRFVTDNWETIN
ncbi:MAG: Unknown protein [uncultured Thiotrichaceae bacterium]|uniref:Uncharacterized protein n=1 Tax=uncultured Thiotrichaceae bacterium TaxID=298394 RepID=A0A6S6SDL5_9GAMM|nr:MAG: Unknown protein [uncultured Thiotrichaceae bacterium]